MNIKISLLILLISFSIISQNLTSLSSKNIQDILNSRLKSQLTNVSMSNKESKIIKNDSYYEDNLYNETLILDKSILPEKYIVGPGDILNIYIWGNIENTYDITVNNEGKLLIPNIGIYDANGKSLELLRNELESIFKQNYRGVKIVITLKSIKSFRVHILGEINKPGSYQVNNATTIIDLIEIADGLTNEAVNRKIRITNDKLNDKIIDLNLIKHSGIISDNFYLNSGDKVFIDKKDNQVSIKGAIKYPGTYDYLVDETLSKLIKSAGGYTKGADTSKILIHRFFNDIDSIVTIEINTDKISSTQVLRDDRVFINSIPDYRIHHNVKISGEIKYPGEYPIQENKTKLKDIIKIAGGFTKDAYLTGSKIIRTKRTTIIDKEFERLKTQPISTLTPIEKSYLKTKLIEESGLLSISFDNYGKNNKIGNIILRNNDEIIIAEKSLSIQVSGAVIKPGLVEFENGQNYSYYIKEAGGFNTRANKRSIKIIKGGDNTWLKPRKVKKLEAGDAIYIAEKQYVDKFLLSKDIILILGSIATIVLSGIAIHDAMQSP